MVWASSGLDATSIHRLRIPSTDLDRVVSESETGLVWMGEPAKVFGPYFSRREATMLDRLLIFPFLADERTQAVLMVTESSFFEEYSEHLSVILAAVADPAARTIVTQRAARETIMRQSIVFKPAEIAAVGDRIAQRASGQIRLIRLDLTDVVSQIASTNEYLDAYRVWQDVLRILAALFATSASVCDAGGHRALLLLHSPHEHDTDLIIHHASASLRHYLPELVASPVLRYEQAIYPDDGEDLPELISRIL